MISKRAKGTYYRNKTKEFYEREGYVVELSENKTSVWINGKIIYAPKDFFGSDLVAMGKNEIIFIQSKTHKTDVSKAIKEFKKYPYPDFVKRHIVRWELRAREPEVVVVN